MNGISDVVMMNPPEQVHIAVEYPTANATSRRPVLEPIETPYIIWF